VTRTVPWAPPRGIRALLVLVVVAGSQAGCLTAGPGLTGASRPPGAPLPAARETVPAPGADAANRFFHKNRHYGTDAYAGPFDVLLNKGFAVAQWEGKSRHIFDYPYGWNAAWKSISSPAPLVDQAGGWRKVLSQQGLPLSGSDFRSGNWLPNYVGHVLEGGIAFRRLREWSGAQGIPLPGIFAGVVTYAASVTNEAYETPPRAEWANLEGTVGASADLLFFDPLGIAIFSFDGPARFMAGTLGANIWPTQAGLIVNDRGQLINNSHSMVFKLPLFVTDWKLFMRTGMGFQAGVTVPRADGLNVTAGIGFESRQRFLDPYTQLESIDAGVSAGLWLDRDNVMLAAVTYDHATDRRVALNVLPGVFDVGGVALGGWFVVDGEGRPYVGLTGSGTLGLGLGWGF
jgi:hypothetical protein